MMLSKEMRELSAQEQIDMARELEKYARRREDGPDLPPWFDGEHVDQVAYARKLIEERDLICVGGCLYDMNGPLNDRQILAEIASDLSAFLKRNIDLQAERILGTAKSLCHSEALQPDEGHVHFLNGYYTPGMDPVFTPEIVRARNRIPMNYDPDPPTPERWLAFVKELLYPEDIPTLQEFMGYLLLPTNRGQKMLTIKGNGGEGKSRIGLVLQKMLGANAYMGSITKLESNRFALANLADRLVCIDDDLNTAALKSTDTIKEMVTCQGLMDIEEKGKQSRQVYMTARLLGFGNSDLTPLYDQSDGFYRRQITLCAREKDPNRVDDPNLTEKLLAELPGILYWCLVGLDRLVFNNFVFTESQRAREYLEDNREEGNSIAAFFHSNGYIYPDKNAAVTSKRLYGLYRHWTVNNNLLAIKKIPFQTYLKDHQNELGIRYTKTIRYSMNKYVRGFTGIKEDPDSNVSADYENAEWT